MGSSKTTVVGIDVGGKRKGFHAVALRDGTFVDRITDPDPNIGVKSLVVHSRMWGGVGLRA